MDNKIVKTGTVGIIGILLTIFGTIYLTPEQLDNTFYCTATEEVGIFYGGISGTGLTAYPYSENRTEYQRCEYIGVKGVWIPIKDYMDENNLDISKLIQKAENNDTNLYIDSNGERYECVVRNSFKNDSLTTSTICKII